MLRHLATAIKSTVEQYAHVCQALTIGLMQANYHHKWFFYPGQQGIGIIICVTNGVARNLFYMRH